MRVIDEEPRNGIGNATEILRIVLMERIEPMIEVRAALAQIGIEVNWDENGRPYNLRFSVCDNKYRIVRYYYLDLEQYLQLSDTLFTECVIKFAISMINCYNEEVQELRLRGIS